jgi:hypothetical protein
MGAEHSRRSQARRHRQQTTVPPLPIISGKNQLISYSFNALLTHDGGFGLMHAILFISLLSETKYNNNRKKNYISLFYGQ